MDPTDIAFIKGIVTFVVLAGTGLSIYWLRLRARALPPADLDRLVRAMRDESDQLHADQSARIAELEERLDFAERRLVQERNPPRADSRIPTPV